MMNDVEKIAKDFEKFGYSKNINHMVENASKLFGTVPSGMTEYQIRQFVFNVEEFPTWYSVYYQASLELWSRYTVISDTVRAVRLKNKQIAVKEAVIVDMKHRLEAFKISSTGRDIKKAVIELKEQYLENMIHEKDMMIVNLTNKIREMLVFSDIMETAKEKMGDIPEWGNMDEENKKWVMKFILTNKNPLKSLVGVDMTDTNKVINSLTKDEIDVIGVKNFLSK